MPESIYSRVSILRKKGLTNAQIIQTLQNEGYTSTQIFDALSQADVISAGYQNFGEKMDETQEQMQYSYPTIPTVSEERIAEISEAIIEEKWSELVEHVNKIIEWKNSIETRLISIEEQFKALKETFDKLHSAVIGKLGEYDVSMKEVGTSIKALEEVFKRILPGFIENVQELSRITARVKASTAKKQTD